MTWAQKQRLAFITYKLATEGRISRPDLMAEFEISRVTASRDFRQFMALYPGLARRDPKGRGYVAGGG